MEGIRTLTEYLPLFKQKRVENDYMPNVEKLIKKVLDPMISDEIRIKVAKLSGKIVDRLSNFMLAEKYSDLFIELFQDMIENKNEEIK